MHALPKHIPPSLARPWLLSPLLPPVDPFEAVIPGIHAGPEVFYGIDVIGPGMGSWVFRRAEDIRAIYRDTEHFTSAGRGTLSHTLGETWDVIPVDTDGAEHAAFRALLNPLFTPARADRLNDHARQLARELIADFAGKGRCEFIGDFARPLPCTVFLAMMGFPRERMPEFLRWEDAIIAGVELEPRQWAVRNIKAFLFDAIAERRANPGDDLLSELLAAQVAGRAPSDVELMGMAMNLFLGGLDTITSMAGWHFKHLATHREDQARLRANPAFIQTALEELLRAYAVVTMQRLCIKQTKLRGVTVMPGDYVTVSTPLAGRDPEAYGRPDEIRLDRAPTHSTFAYGRHRCLGAHIARKELVIMLQEFLAAIPEFRIASGARVTMHLGAQMGIDALPLVWGGLTMLPIFSANAHIIEPAHVFEGRVASKWAEQMPRLQSLENGGQFWMFEGQMGFLHRTCLMAGMRDTAVWNDVGNFNTIANLSELRAGSYDAKARVADMDADGVAVSVCISSPASMGFGGEIFSYAAEPELGIACMRAWNDWYHEEWISAAPDRFVPVGCTWYRDPEVAAREVRRNASRGFRGVALRNPTDLEEAWLGSAHWDPFLAACEETGTVIVHHTEGLGWFPRRGHPDSHYPYGMNLTLYQAGAMDFLAACVWGGITVRFPRLKVLIAESGGSYLPHFLRRLDFTRRHSDFTREGWPAPDLSPLELLQRSFVFSSQEFDVPADLSAQFGTDMWMVEDDYPHIESYFPNTQRHINEALAKLPPALAEAMAWKTGSRLFDFPMPAVAGD